MLNKRMKAVLIGLVTALAVTVLTSGCQLLVEEEETESETASETMSETETEPDTETEIQTNVVYISEDGTVRIVLPDSTWEATQDVDEMRVFASASESMINIVHASDESAMKNISVMESEEDLEATLANQYPEEDAFEVVSFQVNSSSTLSVYEYVVKYNYSTSMWAYSVTYALMSAEDDAAYVVTGTVTEDDAESLDAVQTAVESFTVLDTDSIFSVLPGTVENNATTESETQQAASESEAGSDELTSLSEYSTSVTLYASTNVNIRQQPSTDADRIGSLLSGSAVTVTGETNSWFRVSVGGNTGYISKAYLVSTQPDTDAEAETEASDNSTAVSSSDVIAAELGSEISYGTSYTYYTTTQVNLRSEPSTDSSVVSGVASGTAVTVTGETDNWFIVSVDGNTGYISKSYVSSTQPSTASSSDSDSSGSSAGSTDSSDSSDSSGTTDSSSSGDTDSSTSSSSSTGVVSGTVAAFTSDTIVIQGDDGVTYSINYSNASLNSSGLTEGLYVTATIDYSQTTSGGSLYATDVTGY
ncbi:MAG: SH3 domain-containing protein [Clostridiales bacterium]|nr:SH3 domain-containing protein [Clostridiales bacterium]